jgi:hypothetical protein
VKGAKVMKGTLLMSPLSMVMFATVLDSLSGCTAGGRSVGVGGTLTLAARYC